MSLEIVIPVTGLEPVAFSVHAAPRSTHRMDWIREQEMLAWEEAGVSRAAQRYMGMHMGGAFDYLENKLLDHSLGKSAYTMPQPYLALCTVVPEDSKTGSTITEASYTGYARKKVEASVLNAAASGKSKNNAKLEFPECTAGSSTIIGWALIDASAVGTGNGLYWGTCTSVAISTTQTPAIVPAEQLNIEAD